MDLDTLQVKAAAALFCVKFAFKHELAGSSLGMVVTAIKIINGGADDLDFEVLQHEADLMARSQQPLSPLICACGAVAYAFVEDRSVQQALLARLYAELAIAYFKGRPDEGG